jgi:hypothetical protein
VARREDAAADADYIGAPAWLLPIPATKSGRFGCCAAALPIAARSSRLACEQALSELRLGGQDEIVGGLA